jgi:hydrogenase-4 component B
MRLAMALGAGACLAVGVAPFLALRLVAQPAMQLVGSGAGPEGMALPALNTIVLVVASACIIVALLALGRLLLLRHRDVRTALTWDCGYALPTPRMQYTAASFAAPTLDPFAGLLHARARRTPVAGLFPRSGSEDVHFEDPGEAAVRWTIAAVTSALTRIRALQRGPVQLYLLYVLVTLLLLLIWQART